MLTRNPFTPRRRLTWMLPIWLALVAGGICFIVTTLLPKTYRSEASLYFPAGGDNTTGLLSAVGGLSRFGNPTERGGQVSLFGGALVSPQVASAPQTAIAVLSSRRLRDRVCDKLGLDRKWRLPRYKTVKRLGSVTSLAVDKNGLLGLTVDDSDPSLAAAIGHEHIEQLRTLAKELSLGLSTRNRQFLEGRLATVRQRLSSLERSAVKAAEREPNAAVASGGMTKAAESAVQLQMDRAKAQIALDSVRAQLDWQSTTLDKALRSGVELPAHAEIAQVERARLTDLEAKFAVARAQYGPDHPQLRLLTEELANARTQLDREMRREARALSVGVAPEVAALRARIAAGEAQVAGLDRALSGVQQRLSGLPRRQLERERLQQEIKALRSLIEYLETEAERARVAETRESTTFEVIDAPEVPVEPVSPRRMFSSALSALAGMLLGLAWLVGRSVSRDSMLDRVVTVRAEDPEIDRERIRP